MLTSGEVIFSDEYRWANRNRKNEIKQPHKDLLAYMIRMVEEKQPRLSNQQAKAKGVQEFLRAAGLQVLCIDSFNKGLTGLSILDEETKKELAFIKTNSVLINSIYDLYFDGVFSTSGGPEVETIQGTLGF